MATILRQLIDKFLDDYVDEGHTVDVHVERDPEGTPAGAIQLRVVATPVAGEETPEAEAA